MSTMKSAVVTALVLLTPCLAGSVDLKYEVAGHHKIKTIPADECTNVNGLRGITHFEASADCILYNMVDCLGMPTAIFKGSDKYPPLIVTGSIQCNGDEDNEEPEPVHGSPSTVASPSAAGAQ